jgi:hypothetical protein
VAYITGLGGVPGPGYFTDGNGAPRLWVATETWGIIVNAGEWSSGDWQAEMTGFLSSRSAQGFTVVMTDAVWDAGTGNQGNTWDGLTPLAGGTGDPTGATLNDTFWARFDFFLATAATYGITVAWCLVNGDDTSTGDFTNGWTATQWTDFGALIGARYASTPNLIWVPGNDAFSPFADTQWDAVRSGLTGAGDTHLWAPWYNAECTSRYVTDTDTSEPWGAAHAAFNFCYTYNATYWVIEYAYGEVTHNGASALLPVILGDGWFYTATAGGYSSTDRFQRQMWWWALASGARGVLAESENVYPWTTSSALTEVTGEWFFANNAAHIVSAFTSLTGWHLLIPDTGNALVTGGRGTRVTGSASGGAAAQYSGFANSYVAAARTPDETLAVLYLPNATTITIDQTQMAAGYGAKWMDPVTGATTAATVGSTYNSTAQGSNSQGDPDWVLVLASPPYATWTVP